MSLSRLVRLSPIGVIALVSVFSTTIADADEPSAISGGETAPLLKFEVTPTAIGPWVMKITNTGETPVRLAADPRLLSFDVGGQHCRLPDDARPSTDEGKELVVPATRSWSASFDPLFYCFSPAQRAALSAGATVHAHFGWAPVTTKGKTLAGSPPYVVSPVGASVGKVKAEKQIDAELVTLKDAVTLGESPPPPPKPRDDESLDFDPPPASLSLPATMDAAKGSELTTTVTFHNDGDRPITFVFRPDMVQFVAHGPKGAVPCGGPKTISAPIRELFIGVGAKSHTSLGVLFTATCATGTFDEPGLYRVDARLDTRQASGRAINVKSWDSVATSKEPMLLRVREPRKPRPGRRPLLD